MKTQIIIGSTREGRQSHKLAAWIAAAAKKQNIEVEVVDLRDYDLPLFNEPVSPQYNPERKPQGETKRWLDKVSEADAYVLITPEYNRSVSGVLKNALDYLDYQFAKKPVGIVAHGSTGGAQAVGHLRGIIAGVLAVSVPQVVYFGHRVADAVNEVGELNKELRANPYGPETALNTMLENLRWYTSALHASR